MEVCAMSDCRQLFDLVNGVYFSCHDSAGSLLLAAKDM
jgi:hypothetical protein